MTRCRLLVLGSRDLGQQIAHHATTWGGCDVVGFLDDFRPVGEVTPAGNVLGGIGDLARVAATTGAERFMVAVGYAHMDARAEIFERALVVLPAATLVHPSCVIDGTATIGHGTIVMPGCLLDQRVRVGSNAVLNPACSVSHDTSIADHVFFGPRVTLAGNVVIAQRVFLGVGTTVIDGITIGAGVRTGGGAVVTENLCGPGTFVGVPARKRS